MILLLRHKNARGGRVLHGYFKESKIRRAKKDISMRGIRLNERLVQWITVHFFSTKPFAGFLLRQPGDYTGRIIAYGRSV
jgi:hypothetical protein